MMGFPKTVLSLNPEITDELIVEQIRKLRFGPELENLKCPHCGSKNVHKYGKMHNRKYVQRYYCKNCEKTFNDLTGTILEKCRLTPRPLPVLHRKLLSLENSQRSSSRR